MTLAPEAAAEWLAWVESRPEKIRVVAERFPPWHTYRLKSTGQLARIRAYDEDQDTGECTLRLAVWREWLPFGHGVFGVDPDDLELAIKGDDA